MSTSLLHELDRLLRPRGLGILRCADLESLPADVRQAFPRGISLAVPLDPDIISEIASGPTPAYAAEYRRANALLEELGEICARHLREKGFRAVPTRPTLHLPDAHPLTTPLPHKTVATRSGIGWIGKSALLITDDFGAAIRFTSVLTDAPLPTRKPIDQSRCGTCRACVDACPALAIKGTEWKLGLERDSLFDARACRRQARAFAKQVDIDHPLCGICIAACPYTHRYLMVSRDDD